MSIHIDANSRLHHEQAASFSLNCPHCQVYSHMTAVSVPQYIPLVTHKPNHVGMVYRCDACNAPVFLKFPVKAYATNRVELGPTFTELERPREKFSFSYVPDECELLFKEALSCYTHGCFNAFASMCRRTTQAIFHHLGDNGRLKVFDHLNEARAMAELDNATFDLIRKIVLDGDDTYPPIPVLEVQSAGILLELMKDLLYQVYIRRGKLQQAMMMRKFFADERSLGNVRPLKAMK